MDENIESKPKSKMPMMALAAVALFAFAFVPIGNATLLTYLGNLLIGVFAVQAPVQNLWEPANFTGIANATILGNSVAGSIIAGNAVSLTGTLDNAGVNINKNVVFNFSAVGNNLGAADIPTTGFKLDGISQLMPCASVGSDYICTITGMPILSGPHTFSLDFALDPLYNTAFPPTASMKIQ